MHYLMFKTLVLVEPHLVNAHPAFSVVILFGNCNVEVYHQFSVHLDTIFVMRPCSISSSSRPSLQYFTLFNYSVLHYSAELDHQIQLRIQDSARVSSSSLESYPRFSSSTSIANSNLEIQLLSIRS